MGLRATDTGGRDFKKVPQGCHFAICNMVVDLGVQRTEYQGEVKKVHQIYLRWEVPDERVTYEKDGRQVEGPQSIGATYTLSMSPKANLRKIIENWTGKTFPEKNAEFDVTQLAGTCCQIMVTHKTGNGKVYANVTGVMGISKDQKQRAATAKSEVGVVVYDLETDDPAMFDKLPKWLKEKLDVREADGDRPVTGGKDAPTKSLASELLDDDLPF